ncbi:MAG: histidine phosphatase family protein, partial [Rhodanobacteraceae bacterium]
MNGHTTTLLLVRHGHVEGIQPERFRGRAELPLTGLGESQAEALRDRIAVEWSPEAVYSSPMGRCLRTATILAQPSHSRVQSMPGLNDIDYGAWQGMSDDEVRPRWPEELARWRRTPHLATIPGGESLRDLATRTISALHAILHAHRDRTIVIVAHDSVNRVLLLHALDLPLAR